MRDKYIVTFYCGEKDANKLDFHHRDGKSFTIGGNYHKPWGNNILDTQR